MKPASRRPAESWICRSRKIRPPVTVKCSATRSSRNPDLRVAQEHRLAPFGKLGKEMINIVT
jgi:hypothetical protein